MNKPYRLPDEIRTRRLLLRRASIDDAGAIFASYATDPDVTRFLGWQPHDDVSQTEEFLTIVSKEWEDGRGFPLVVFAQDDPGQLLGMFHPKLRGATVNYGYVLRRESWGKGYGTEALRHLVDHAMASVVIHRAEAFCDVEHRASARVMQKAGMQFEGTLRRYFVHPNISAEPRDCAIYARVRGG